ncbi:hypothetical protein [Mycolicibacterium tusciae]|uniref:Intersectin-EH binding protein Ibp1 n=1 Tax=Mycolicibacterium tusciae TaxID=75922 RepID=A0A1X0JN95_9MYCO|nr:hypothetical protein [Mycolicibacterium tusciae]ORB64281.1 hypothetical protein BST47_16990 [Mycolicibacterium tusciae]
MGATHRFTRRLTISGGLAAVAAAPLVAAVLVAPASQSTYLGQCSSGEEGDAYTGQCVPYLVPNSPGGNPAAAPAGNAASSACPAGVSGSECAIQPPANSGPNMPANPPPQQPEQELADVVTPGY